MRPDQRTKLAVDLFNIFADFEQEHLMYKYMKEYDEQTYTRCLEEIEQYISEKIG